MREASKSQSRSQGCFVFPRCPPPLYPMQGRGVGGERDGELVRGCRQPQKDWNNRFALVLSRTRIYHKRCINSISSEYNRNGGGAETTAHHSLARLFPHSFSGCHDRSKHSWAALTALRRGETMRNLLDKSRRRRILFVVPLLLLAAVEWGISAGRAEIHYNGGYVQIRRNPNPPIGQQPMPSAPQGTRPAPSIKSSSYSPDNDFEGNRIAPSGESKNPDSPTTTAGRMLIGDTIAEAFPWNQVDFVDYRETIQVPKTTALSVPKKYSLEVATLRSQPRDARTESAGLIAHLPEHALLWVEESPTGLTGKTRIFRSPPLRPDRKYSYRVRAVWIEDGHWVSETRTVPVRAGGIEAVYLLHRPH
jgi:uncharacterized protein (TIGR03000 family)